MNALQKITKARAGLVLDAPFFGALALRLQLLEDATCITAWTNSKALGFNPDFIDALPLEQVKAVLAHEVMHVACRHHTRRGDRDKERWNAAGDYVVNQHLKDTFRLPAGALLDPRFDGMSTEQVYNLLPAQPSGGDGQDQNKPDSGAGADPGGMGEVRDFPGENGPVASGAELAQAEAEAKIAATQAAKAAKMLGRLPAGLERLVQDLAASKMDWRELLRRFVEQAAKNDSTWSRPNRRFVSQGLYLPSMHNLGLGRLVVAVDTSASVGQETLAQFAAEISAIVEEFQTRLTVIYCDAKVQDVQELGPDDLPLRLTMQGGGGTSFDAPFLWIEEHLSDQLPAGLIYLTDGRGRVTVDEPEYPVLWATTEREGFSLWGEVSSIVENRRN